jgi:hypothetical protein
MMHYDKHDQNDAKGVDVADPVRLSSDRNGRGSTGYRRVFWRRLLSEIELHCVFLARRSEW